MEYDSRSVTFHWATACLVILQWGGARAIHLLPKGPLRLNLWSGHILIGVALLGVVIARLLWRHTQARRPEIGGPAPLRTAAVTMHWLLYGLLLAVLLVGVVNSAMHGSTIFGWFKIPVVDPQNRALRNQVGSLHDLLANILLIAAGLHAVAALLHDRLWQRGSLARMIPALRKTR